MLQIVLNGTVRNALLMQVGKMLYQLPDKLLKLASNSIVELRKLKTHQLHRSNHSHLSTHTEGHLVDAEEQFHDLVLDEGHWPLKFHQASAHAQIDDFGRIGHLASGQRLNAG